MTTTTDLVFYVRHYVSLPQVALMLAVAFISVAIGVLILSTAARHMSRRYTSDTRALFIHDETASLTERFYELIFSCTSILFFVSIYFIMDYFGVGGRYQEIWEQYDSILLLLCLLASILLNSFIDRRLVPLNHVRSEERATMRLIGMLYMLIIFAYIKFIYNDDNYDNIIMYFLTLVLGRFIYFDTSLKSFRDAVTDALRSLPILFPALLCTGMIALFGFTSGYLLRANGVAFNLFIGHLYLVIAAALFHHLTEKRLRKLRRHVPD